MKLEPIHRGTTYATKFVNFHKVPPLSLSIINHGSLSLFLYIATFTATCQGIPYQIHLLRPQPGFGGHRIPGIVCLSWRLVVETNNIREWVLVPQACENYVGHYM